jgi:hypothetical protein
VGEGRREREEMEGEGLDGVETEKRREEGGRRRKEEGEEDKKGQEGQRGRGRDER